MFDKMMVYNALPVWGQNLACYYEGLKISRNRYGRDFWRLLSEYEGRNEWSYSQKCEYRDGKLRKLITHCYQTVPYYKRLFDDGGINPESIKHLEDLKVLPVLTKEIIKKNPESFLSSAFDKKEMKTAHTSGSTGAGFVFKTTNQALCEQWAVWWRYRRAIGISFDEWCALFGGRNVVPISDSTPPFFRWNRPCKQMYFSTYHMSDNTLNDYVKAIRNNKINWIHGYPSSISILADYMINNGISINVDFITTGAENLLEAQKNKIKEAFGHEPFQHYGLSEATANFSENKDHYMYVDEDFAAVEFIPDGNGFASIIGTNLSNYAMPFIRYNTGDVCSAEETINGRLITSLDGRKEDCLILGDGTKVGRLDHIFKDMVNVKEAQFVQSIPGQADLFIVRGGKYTEADERQLKQEISSRLQKIRIQIKYVDKIQKTKSGKLRFVITENMDG